MNGTETIIDREQKEEASQILEFLSELNSEQKIEFRGWLQGARFMKNSFVRNQKMQDSLPGCRNV